ncbi:MAG: hypothetical protein LAO20_12780 [Acidobacteriia bacterium]|nr:hypothetical protein [Terriglobia bacterium]
MAVAITVMVTAAFPRFFQLTTFLFGLPAVFTVPADGLLQFVFRFVNSLFAFPVTITVAIVVTVLGKREAAKHQARRENG